MVLPTPLNRQDDMTGNGCECQMKGKGKTKTKAKGKPKTLGKTVWDLFGDKRGAAPYEEDLLPGPNSNNRGVANF